MGFFGLFGKPSKKEINKEKMQRIRENGKSTENWHDMMHPNDKKTYHGADRVSSYRDRLGRRREQTHEIKRNNSPVSPLQKKRAQFIHRYNDDGTSSHKYRDGSPAEQDFSGRWRKAKKNDYTSFGFGNMFNSEPKPSRRNNNYNFGSGLGDMFGSGTSKSTTRKNRNNDFGFGSGLGDMFGSGSSKRKRNSSGSWGF